MLDTLIINGIIITVDEMKIIEDAGRAFHKMMSILNRSDVYENPRLYDLRMY